MLDTATLLPLLRAAAGLSPPQTSQFEDIAIADTSPLPDGATMARLTYCFDQDGHSQYDKTICFEAQALFRPALGWSLVSLQLTHTGVAAIYTPPEAMRRRGTDEGRS